MAITAQPEVLRPGQKTGRRAIPTGSGPHADLDFLSHLLDDFIHIPGTPFRLGLDGIVGFIPGIGDLLGGLASTIIIVAAWRRGVARTTVARMVANVAIETAVGALPVVGNLFDIGWKANRRNYALLTRSLERPETARQGNWLFIAGVCVVLAALMAVPLLLGGWVLLHARQWLQR